MAVNVLRADMPRGGGEYTADRRFAEDVESMLSADGWEMPQLIGKERFDGRA